MGKTHKYTRRRRRTRRRYTRQKLTSRGGADISVSPDAAPAAAPAAASSVEEQIEALFISLKAEQKKIIDAEAAIENINKLPSPKDAYSVKNAPQKLKDIKAENKKIKDAYAKIEEIVNEIKALVDKEKSDRGKKIIDMYVMKFFHEPGKKTPTVYFDNYMPNTDEKQKLGIDDEDFWVNPTLQLGAIDEILDMKKSRITFKPEKLFYKVEGNSTKPNQLKYPEKKSAAPTGADNPGIEDNTRAKV